MEWKRSVSLRHVHYRARPCLRSQQIIIIESSIDQQHRGFAAAAELFIQMAFQLYSSARRLCALAYNQAAPFFIQHNQKEKESAGTKQISASLG